MKKKSKTTEKKSKTSDFIAKLLKKVSCFHLPSDSAVSEEDVADHHHEKQQPQPQQQRPPRQPPPQQQLVICYGGVGVNLGSMKCTGVPMKHVSSSVTLRALLEQSGVELETTLERGWVVIWCEFAEVESTLKLVEAIVKGKERVKKSSSSSLENM